MNKETFKNYERDINTVGGVASLPEGHKLAYEIIKEGSADFSDFEQLIAVAEEPTISEAIEKHLAWLDAQLKTSAPSPVNTQNDKKEKTVKVKPAKTTTAAPTPKKSKPTPKKKAGRPTKTITKNVKPVKTSKVTATLQKKIGEDILTIKSFLNLHKNHNSDKHRIANLFRLIQKKNTERRYTDSEYKPELNQIVANLKDGYKNGKLHPASEFIQRLESIKQSVMYGPSVQIIRSFYNHVGEKISNESASRLIRAIDKIGEGDKYAGHLTTIRKGLVKAMESGESLELESFAIQGLSGVLADCGCNINRPSWDAANEEIEKKK